MPSLQEFGLNEDIYYLKQMSSSLKLFHQTQKNHFMFSCPYCGDSKKSKYKTRGTLFPRGNRLIFGCFNCGYSTNFQKFLRDQNPLVYKEYLFNKFKCQEIVESEEKVIEEIETSVPYLLDLNSVFPVTASSEAKEYLKNRIITNFKNIYFTNNAAEIIEKYRPETKRIENFKNQHAIVFPLVSYDEVIFGVQMRFLHMEDFRYMTIMIDRRFPKCFGLNNVKENEDIWVTEGIFDAMLLPNYIANLDASLHTISEKTGIKKDKFILVYDNEPRNKEIMKMLRDGMETGYRIFFWPKESADHGKDLNSIAVSNPSYFQRLMNNKMSYVKSGLSAKLELGKYLGN